MNRSAPLTPEERELARLLGRTAPTAPSSALDQAVLAAARASLQPQPAAPSAPVPEAAAPARDVPRPARRHSRLPAALGLAASVVFAVGIAWQLKPDAPQPTPNAAAPSAAVEALPAPAAAPVAAEARDDGAPMAAADVAAGATAPAAKPSVPPPAPPRAGTRAPFATRPVPAPIVAAPMPPPPPAPAAPMAAAPSSQAYSMDAVAAPALEKITTTGSRARQQATDIQSAPMAAEPARNAAGAPGVMRRAAPAAVRGTLSDSVVNAAVDADATLPRKQWLQRIRERRDNGDVDTARASLERYLQHYPETRIPRDVRQLLDN